MKRELIVKILKKHKGKISAADVVTEAAAQGVETTKGYVGLVRHELIGEGVITRSKRGRRKHGEPQAAPEVKPVDVNGFSTADLLAVKALSARFGVGLDALPGKVTEAVQTLKALAS